MADFFGKMSIFGTNTRITPEHEKYSQLLCEPSSKNSGTRSKSNSFSGNRVSPAPLPEERTRSKSDSFSGNRVSPAPLQKEDIEHIETLPGTPMSGHESGVNTPQLVASPDELVYGCGIRSGAEDIHAYSEGRLCEAWSPEEYDMHEWLEIDRPAEHNYLRHVRTIYKHVLDDLYRRFVPPVNIHEKYLEEIRSPSWETFEKNTKNENKSI